MKKTILLFVFVAFSICRINAQTYISDSSNVIWYRAYSHSLLIVDEYRNKLADGNYIIYYGNDSFRTKLLFEIRCGKLDGYYTEFTPDGKIHMLILFKEGRLENGMLFFYSEDKVFTMDPY